MCEAFNTLALIRQRQGRIEESIALRERGLSLALEHDLPAQALRAHNNLADGWLQLDRFGDALRIIDRGLALARSRGDHRWEDPLTLNGTTAHVARGEWEQLPPLAADGLPAVAPLLRRAYLPALARVQVARGDAAAMERTLRLAEMEEDSTNVEFAAGPDVARAIVLNGVGRHTEALSSAMPLATGSPEQIVNEDRREAYLEAGLAALALDDQGALETLITFVADLPPAQRSPLLRVGMARFDGLLAARRGDMRRAEDQLSGAIRELRSIETPFVLAQVLLEHAELVGDAGEAEEARRIFERLRATPWLERCSRFAARAAV